MQNLKKYVIPILLSILLAFVALYKYVLNLDYFQDKINSYMSQSNWTLKIDSISGSIFGSMKIDNVILTDDNKRKVIFKTLELNIGLFDTFFKKPSIDFLSINDMTIDFNESSNKPSFSGEFNDSFLKNMMIREIFINGYFNLNSDDFIIKSDLLLEGSPSRLFIPSLIFFNSDLFSISKTPL